MFRIVSNDGVTFEMSEQEASYSDLLKGVIDDIHDDSKSIPLDISSVLLTIIVDFCKRHSSMTEDECFAAFIPSDQSTLLELIVAANYLNMPSLINLTCKAVANSFKGKTPLEICEQWSIPKNTPEEDEIARREIKWYFE